MNNFNNFLNHLNSFTKKQPIREQSSNYSYPDSSMKRLGKDLSNPTAIGAGALAGGGVGFALGGPPGALVGSAVGALNGVAYNALPTMMNNFSPDDPELDTDFNRVQKRTEQEEQKRREAVFAANPDLAARMQEDPRNRPGIGIGMGIARAMNDMSRMQTKVNAASRNLNNLQNPLKEMFNFSYNVEKRQADQAAMNSPDANSNTVSQSIAGHDAAARSEYVKGFHNTNHADPAVAMAALNSPDATNETTLDYAKHADPQVAIAALNHPMVSSQTVDIASTHPHASVVMAALNHPMATSHTTHNGVGHPNPDVALMALNHPQADGGTIMYGKQHPDSKVVAAAIGHLTNDDQIMKNEIEKGNFMYLNHRLRGGKAPDSDPGSQNNPLSHPIQEPQNNPAIHPIQENTYRSIFLNHLNSFSNNIQEASDEGDFAQTRRLKQQGAHPGIPGFTVNNLRPSDIAAAVGSDREKVGMAALMHPDIDHIGVAMAARHGTPQVAMAALNHPLTTQTTLLFAAQNPNPQVAMAALDHPLADQHVANTAQKHPDPKVTAAAFAFEGPRQQVIRQPSTFAAAEASRQRFPRIDTGARDINGDPIKPAPTPGETAFKQWIRSF